ncbi:hypothetical protein ACIA03_07135 [Nocardioides sp. NPDC051685]|uniref:hypothetical protein n=1 Tax=Nocardioides sp. NPDC051685 TaxID=3364334 RepID=UPI0037B478D0
MRFDERYVARITLDPGHDTGRYPFTLPAVRELAGGAGSRSTSAPTASRSSTW